MGNRKQSKQSDGLNEHFVMYCMVEIANLSNFSNLETGYCSGPQGWCHLVGTVYVTRPSTMVAVRPSRYGIGR